MDLICGLHLEGVRHEEWLPGTEFSCFSVVSKPPTFSINFLLAQDSVIKPSFVLDKTPIMGFIGLLTV